MSEDTDLEPILPKITSPVIAAPLEMELERRDFIKRFNAQELCDSSCPVVLVCSFAGKYPECFYRKFPKKVQDRFANLWLNGKEGMITELINALVAIGVDTDTEGKLADRRAYADLLMRVMKTVYGETPQSSQSQQQTVIDVKILNVEDMHTVYSTEVVESYEQLQELKKTKIKLIEPEEITSIEEADVTYNRES